MHSSRKQRITAAVLACLLLSACGFHVRTERSGAANIQVDRIYVGDERADNLADEVRSQLKDASVTVTDSADNAQFVILLAKESFRRDVLSVSPKTGKVEEYQVTLSAKLTLKEVGGKTLLDNDPVSQVRDFIYDQNAALGKFSEEETLRDELTRDAADQVLRRVSAVLATPR